MQRKKGTEESRVEREIFKKVNGGKGQEISDSARYNGWGGGLLGLRVEGCLWANASRLLVARISRFAPTGSVIACTRPRSCLGALVLHDGD